MALIKPSLNHREVMARDLSHNLRIRITDELKPYNFCINSDWKLTELISCMHIAVDECGYIQLDIIDPHNTAWFLVSGVIINKSNHESFDVTFATDGQNWFKVVCCFDPTLITGDGWVAVKIWLCTFDVEFLKFHKFKLIGGEHINTAAESLISAATKALIFSNWLSIDDKVDIDDYIRAYVKDIYR